MQRKKQTQTGSKEKGTITLCFSCNKPLDRQKALSVKCEAGRKVLVCNEKCKGLVSSKNELTTKNGKDTPQVASLKVYRKGITDMTKQIKGFAIGLCKDNLLSVKMALMGAVREVEEMMKKNRKEG